MGTKLYVGNLSWGIKDDGLRQAFEKAGAVESATVIIESHSGRSKGFGFVEMGSEAEAQAAIEMWNEKELDGRALIVNEARPPKPRESRW